MSLMFTSSFRSKFKSYSSVVAWQRCLSQRCYHRQVNSRSILESRTQRQILSEYRAAVNLFARSNLTLQHGQASGYINVFRLLSTTSHLNQEDDKNKKDKKGDEKKDKDEDDEDGKTKVLKFLRYTAASYVAIAVLMLMFPSTNQPDVVRYISWNEFVHHMLAKGEVEQLIVRPEIDLVTVYLHEGAVIKGKRTEHRTYHINIVDVDNFETKLRAAEKSLNIKPEHAVPVIYERNDETSWIIIVSILAVVLMSFMMMKQGQMKMPNPTDMFSGMTKAKFTMIDPLTGGGKGVKFSDVAGLKEAKVEINEFVSYLQNAEKYKALGAKVPKGVLLLGPPGCGKTMLAKAVATEASVPFLAMAGSEFIEMIGGLGASRVRDLFKEARKRAPCIVYIDEIDAIGRKRSGDMGGAGGGSGEEEQTLNQLLVEMDGMAGREGVIMLASTNRADVLDRALLRAGRFDRHILIDYPTLIERKEIFEHHLKPIKLEKSPSYYSSRMAQLTPRFTGADIAQVCNEAALKAARTLQKQVVGQDLEYAVERVVGGTEKRTQVMSPEERKIVAYHESGHALVGWLLEHTDALLKVTIVPRTKGVLGFAMNVQSDQKLYSTEELFERMCMVLGGRVAESITFNKISTGAENDLKKVTQMAYAQIRQFGMDPVVGPLSFPTDEERSDGRGFVGSKPYSKRLANTMDLQSRMLIAKAYTRTEKVLSANRDKLKLIAESLMAKETLDYQDVVKLIGPPPFGAKKLIDVIDFGPTGEADTDKVYPDITPNEQGAGDKPGIPPDIDTSNKKS